MELTRPDDPDDSVLDDDVLRLIFTCCHPSLAPEARLALALRTLCQLSVAQVAAALLTSEAAMAKRLTRTRQKIALARIGYRVPADAELPERLGAVCGVVHALYTAGHAPLDRRVGAGRRPLHRGTPAGPRAAPAAAGRGDARRGAGADPAHRGPPAGPDRRARRPGAAGRPGPDPRGTSRWSTRAPPCWNEACDGPAESPIPTSCRPRSPTSTTGHRRTPDTDWAEIVRLYDLLLSVAPSVPAALGRAVAWPSGTDPRPAWRRWPTCPASQRREAVRSELLGRLGRFAEAAEAVSAALDRGGAGGPAALLGAAAGGVAAAAEPARQVGGTA